MNFGIQGTIVGHNVTVGIHVFNPTARLADPESLLIKITPILDGGGKPTDMDEVEMVLVKSPFLIKVVDVKADIGRYPSGLDGRDVSSNDVAGRELIAKVDRPQP